MRAGAGVDFEQTVSEWFDVKPESQVQLQHQFARVLKGVDLRSAAPSTRGFDRARIVRHAPTMVMAVQKQEARPS
jgi:hypothetical protein